MTRKWEIVYWACERALHPSARRTAARAGAGPGAGPGAGLGALRGHGTVLVVTFRRNGDPVPTPLSCALKDGRLYASTAPDSGKVKRIRRDPRVLVAPSTVRGRALGPRVEAAARVLDAEDARRAERILDGRFGLLRRLYRRAVGADATHTAYLEITPDTVR